MIKVISCLLCDIIRTQYEVKAAFRLRSLFTKHFLQRRMQEPMPARSPSSSGTNASISLPMCICRELHDRKIRAGTLNQSPLIISTMFNGTSPLTSECFPTPKSTCMASSRRPRSKGISYHRKSYILGLCCH